MTCKIYIAGKVKREIRNSSNWEERGDHHPRCFEKQNDVLAEVCKRWREKRGKGKIKQNPM